MSHVPLLSQPGVVDIDSGWGTLRLFLSSLSVSLSSANAVGLPSDLPVRPAVYPWLPTRRSGDKKYRWSSDPSLNISEKVDPGSLAYGTLYVGEARFDTSSDRVHSLVFDCSMSNSLTTIQRTEVSLIAHGGSPTNRTCYFEVRWLEFDRITDVV